MQINSIPTVLLFKDGQLKDKFIGVKDEKGLESFVKKSIAN
jgi:thioredoxin-like negative regulator of GroEL